MYSRVFSQRGVFRWVGRGRTNPHRTPKELYVCTTPFVWFVRVQWSASNEGGVQSLARRSRYRNTAALNKFECDCFLTQKTRFGNLGLRKRNRSSFGPNFTRPAQIWPYRVRPVSLLACRTRTARNRRVKDAHRSVTGPLSAASARYICALQMGDSATLGR